MRKLYLILGLLCWASISWAQGFSNGASGSASNPVYIAPAGSFTTLIDYQGGTNAVYIGVAAPGSSQSLPAWRIEKIIYDGNGNALSILWASNSAYFGDIWNNRTSLNYA